MIQKSVFALLFLSSVLRAQVYEFNTQQLGQWNGAGEGYSDIWGYAAGGKEYAILGSAQYIYFFEVTNPANIRLVDKFGPYTATSWREFKTYGHYAYAVTDGPDAGGLRIFDLQYLPDTVIQVRQTTAFFSKCHMSFIDEANGRMYCAGTNTQNTGIIVLNLATRPDSPSIVINQSLPRGYVHDMYVKNNVMYASHIYAGYLSQYNCAGNSCSGELSTFQTGGYNHSSWMNEDQTLMINAIETAGHPLWLFPITNGAISGENYKKFKSVTLKDQYANHAVADSGSIGHNPYIIGDKAYVSYYTDGVQIYNISDVNNIRRVAYFDTDRGHTSYSPVFRGCWGTYPFLPSGNILASDIQSGLWIFKTTACASSQPPTIVISSNAPSYPWGSNITINANVGDPDGSILKVEFYNGNVLIGTDLDAPFNYTVNSASLPNYVISAKVFDNCGISTNSAVLNISTTTSCTDGFQNGNETGVDCGGGCGSCLPACITSINLSQGKVATQSSDYSGAYPASRAVDGNLVNFSHTNIEAQPWWQVDLGLVSQVGSIELTMRTDCCGERIRKFKVFVSNDPVTSYNSLGIVYEFNNSGGVANGQVINIPNINLGGRYVRVWADHTSYGNNYLHLAEVKVMGCCLNNQSPTISLSSTANSYPQGSSFTVNATANDVGGNVTSVEFYNGNTLLGIDNTEPYSYTISPATSASYNLTAKAIDNCSGSTTSSPLIISTTSTCSDGFQNGTETGLDCGGSCTACAAGCISSTNISQGKPASQSTNFNGANSYPASLGIDGSVTSSSFNHTGAELQPWWQVDLGTNHLVTSIEITHRTGCPSCAGRIKKFRIFVSPSVIPNFSTGGFVYEYNNSAGLANGEILNIPNLSAYGRYVRIWADHGTIANYLHLAEIKVMGCSSSVDPCLNNTAPTVSVNTSLPTYPQGSSFTVNATAGDVGGTITGVEFYNGSNLLGVDNSAPYSYIVNPASASSYTISAKAIDNCNLSTTSSTITITTTSACNDGFQNGSETGVDCGGNCTACLNSCTSSVNISQGKPATQSTNFNAANSYPASMGVDGSTAANSFNHTATELQPWWQVDLGNNYNVTSIEITHRTGCAACISRLKKFRVFISNAPVAGYSSGGFVYEYNNSTGMGNGQVILIPNLSSNGRYIRVWADNGTSANYLHLAEVKVMGCSSSSLTSQPPVDIPGAQTTSSAKTDLLLYPNPGNDWIFLQFKIQPESELLLRIFDLQGRLLAEERVVDNKFNISRFDSGTYLVRIQDKNNTYVHKIIKM